MQRALLQWRRPEVRRTVIAALKKAGRTDLIGFGPDCLLRPDGERPRRATGRDAASAPAAQKKTAPQPNRPVRKAGWAKAKPKKNARPNRPHGKG